MRLEPGFSRQAADALTTEPLELSQTRIRTLTFSKAALLPLSHWTSERHSVFIHIIIIIIICFSLTGSAVGSTSTSSNIDGQMDITLLGPDVVTVGIPASFFCFSRCSAACLYSITADGHSADTNEITIIIRERLNVTTVTCTAKNIKGQTFATNKTLQVIQGPDNVSISGPVYLPVDSYQSFLCSAVCWPSCNYSWISNGLPLSASGNQLVVTPSAAAAIETLVCTATNSKSGIFASAVRKLFVTENTAAPLRIDLMSAFIIALSLHFT